LLESHLGSADANLSDVDNRVRFFASALDQEVHSEPLAHNSDQY